MKLYCFSKLSQCMYYADGFYRNTQGRIFPLCISCWESLRTDLTYRSIQNLELISVSEELCDEYSVQQVMES